MATYLDKQLKANYTHLSGLRGKEGNRAAGKEGNADIRLPPVCDWDHQYRALASLSLFEDQCHAIHLSLHLEEYATIHPGSEDAEINKTNKDSSPKKLPYQSRTQMNRKHDFE